MKNIAEKFNIYILLLFVLAQNFHREWSSPILVLFFISSLANRNKEISFKKELLPFIIYFLVQLFSLTYSEDLNYAGKRIVLSLSLIVIPECFFLSKLNFREHQIKIYRTFLVSTLLALIINLLWSFINYLDSGSIHEFFYLKLSKFQHTSYFALSQSIGILVTSYLLLKDKTKNWQILYKLAPFLLASGIVLTASKTGIIGLIFSLPIFIYYLIKTSRKKLIAVSFTSICLVLITWTLFFQSPTQHRFRKLSKSLDSSTIEPEQKKGSAASRIKIWTLGVDTALHAPILGYGVGDGNEVLSDLYSQNGYEHLIKKKFNAHNQFLQTFLETGALGLIVLIWMIVLPVFSNFSIWNILITGLFVLNLFTESFLCKQIGVNLFVLSYTLLLLSNKFRTQTTNQQKEEEFLKN